MALESGFRLHIRGPDTSQEFLVPRGTTTIGRQVGNDLQLDHPHVSRRHAQLECTPTECQITDLGSSNGTRVNEARLTPHVAVRLDPGAIIRIGPFELSFEQVPIEAVEAEDRSPVEESPVKPPPGAVEPAREAAPPAGPSLQVVEREVTSPLPPPPPPPIPPPEPATAEESPVPPGLSVEGQRLLRYLPGIYHTDFVAQFLGIFESILTPLEWNVDNFDLYLTPGTAPIGFLPWLANWFEITFDSTWSEAQRRTLLAEAHQIYARRGTRWALSRVLEIYTGQAPEIVDLAEDLDPFTFKVKLPLRERDVDRELIEAIVDANKPAHASYRLEFAGR